MKIAARHFETVLLVPALLLLAGSGGWARWRMTKEESVRLALTRHGAATDPASSVENGSAVAGPSPEAGVWEPPRPQAGGPGWIYQLFTPPALYRRPESGEWVASPPAAQSSLREPRHGNLELVAVHRTPFRLQLVGFAGEAGNVFGLFEDVATTEHFLAAAGQAIPALGLTVERCRLIPGPHPDSAEAGTGTGLVAEALVRDESSGEVIALTDRGWTYCGDPAAILAAGGKDGERFTLHRDEEIERGGIRYRLRDVHLVPPAVELTVESPAGEETETWTLDLTSEGGS